MDGRSIDEPSVDRSTINNSTMNKSRIYVPKGLFIDELDWNDPRYAPYNIENLGELNDDQTKALLDDDEIDFGPDELTEEELKEVCLNVDCRVDLGSTSANVCTGVEVGWPKRLFDEPHFKRLQPKQQRYIYASMERRAVLLSDTYFKKERFDKKRERRKRNAMAEYYEMRFRRNRFNRIKALGVAGHSANNNDSTIASVSVNLNEDSINDVSMDNNTQESMASLETVINTGRTQSTQPSQNLSGKTDENDNECADVDATGIGENNENDANVENVKNTLPKRRRGRPSKSLVIPQESVADSSVDKVANSRVDSVLQPPHISLVELEISDDEEDDVSEEIGHADIFTESMTASQSSIAPDDGSDSDRRSFECVTPNIASQEFVSQPLMTPRVSQLKPNSLFDMDEAPDRNDTDIEADDDPTELDFLRGNMLTVQTSTQQ